MLAVLVALNLGYWAWTKGALAPLGLTPQQHREPQRLDGQLNADAVRVMSAVDADRLERSALAGLSKECLQSQVMSDAEAAAARIALEGAELAQHVQFAEVVLPERWIVYMGKYANADALTKKKSELQALGVPWESVQRDDLQPGLALASAPTQTEATRQMTQLTRKGIRTAKVLREREGVRGQRLKLPAVDDALRERMDEVRATVPERNLQTCA